MTKNYNVIDIYQIYSPKYINANGRDQYTKASLGKYLTQKFTNN